MLGIDYPWVASDLNNAVAIFGSWVRGQMMDAEARLRGRRKKQQPTAAEVNAERQKAWEIAVTGERRRTARRAQGPAEVRRVLGMLAKL